MLDWLMNPANERKTLIWEVISSPWSKSVCIAVPFGCLILFDSPVNKCEYQPAFIFLLKLKRKHEIVSFKFQWEQTLLILMISKYNYVQLFFSLLNIIFLFFKIHIEKGQRWNMSDLSKQCVMTEIRYLIWIFEMEKLYLALRIIFFFL